MTNEQRTELAKAFANVINTRSIENESNTPDFVLGNFLVNCLDAFNVSTKRRDNWYGGKQSILESEKSERWLVAD